ncbi:PEP-CTERM sorting domain-containing protein [Rubritalea spongiae]|uniref:PEP-CTERM sorting domain-containing protein n=1 Tax=Rubritalea spongiae TaxID=430797 RepID=UPI00361C4A0E
MYKLPSVCKKLFYCVPVLLLGQVNGASMVTSGTASGLGLDVDLSILAVDVGVGPYAQAYVSSPVPDTDTGTVSNLSVGIGTLGALGYVEASVIDAEALSNVDGVSASGNTVGSSSVTGLELSLVSGVLFAPNILTISSTSGTAISSSSSVTGSYGSLFTLGESELEDVTLSIAGIDFNLATSYAANTLLDVSAAGLAGISVHLNEQIVTGTGTESYSLVTNAMRIELDAVDLGGALGLISGDIIVGQSFAEMNAVPEPSTTLSLGLGAVGMLCIRRRRS